YGTSYYGGASEASGPGGYFAGYGSAFSCTSTGTLKLTHSFYIRDAYEPYDSPTVPISGFSYGTTYYGGQFGSGAIYKIGTTGAFAFTILHSFNNYAYEGFAPTGGL